METQRAKEIAFLRTWVLKRLRQTYQNVSEEDRQDALQDALLRMCEHDLLSFFDTRQRALSWLWKVAKNRMIDVIRRRRDDPSAESLELYEDDERIHAIEIDDTLQFYLGRLSPHVRVVFELLREGLSVKEAASMLGRKIHTVHVQHERAILKLQRLVKKDRVSVKKLGR